MIRYVIFDFDGTLANSQSTFISVFNNLAKSHRFKQIDKEAIPELSRMPIKDRIARLDIPLYKLPFLTGRFLSLYRQQLASVKLFEGIPEMLDLLRQRGYQVAVLSSNDKDNVNGVLRDHGVDIADVVCSRSLFGKDKLMKKFLSKYRLRASEAVYVGDELRDAIACEKAALKMIWVTWGYEDPFLKEPYPQYIAHTPADIPSLVEKLN